MIKRNISPTDPVSAMNPKQEKHKERHQLGQPVEKPKIQGRKSLKSIHKRKKTHYIQKSNNKSD